MINNQQMSSFLDAHKKRYGIEQTKSAFYKIAKNNQQQAALQINQATLTFPTLYVLIPEIQALSMYNVLNTRNAYAVQFCAKILHDDSLAQPIQIQPATREQKYHVLKWMFVTGWQEDGLCNQFDHILDIVTAVLIKQYKDQSILPTIVHEIFERNQKGFLVHDLVWNFYQARNPNALKLVARYLQSSNPEDVKLACEILHFTPEIEQEVPGNPHSKYEAYLNWFQENQPYFYFSGESMQCSSEPEAFKIDLDAKYLTKSRPAASNKKIHPLNKFEQEQLKQFKNVQDPDQKLLSNYSCRMHSLNPQLWNQWMHSDIHQQLQAAKSQEGNAQ